MVPPLKRAASVKRQSFMIKRKESLKIEEPEHLTIAQLKATLRAGTIHTRAAHTHTSRRLPQPHVCRANAIPPTTLPQLADFIAEAQHTSCSAHV